MPAWGSKNVEEDLVRKEEGQKQTTALEETNSTHNQATTQTPGSDIWMMEKQSEPVTTPLPAVNKYYSIWLIPITINQVSTLALLDTGATYTMIGRPLYATLQTVKPLKVKQDEDLRLEVIGGRAAPMLGITMVQIGIAGGSYKHEIVISANRENPNCILVADFFCQDDCELSM